MEIKQNVLMSKSEKDVLLTAEHRKHEWMHGGRNMFQKLWDKMNQMPEDYSTWNKKYNKFGLVSLFGFVVVWQFLHVQ